MSHSPFHVLQERRDQFLARGKELYEERQGFGGGYAGAFAAQSGMLPELSGSDRAALLAYESSISSQNRARGPLGRLGGMAVGLFQASSKKDLVKDFKGYLNKQGFSKQEQLQFFQALDKDPKEFFGDKMPLEKGEQIRFLKEYFKEAQDLYDASAATERDMMQEERAAREQTAFDKAQREAFGLTEQEEGQVADRRRKQQQSKEYLESRGGMSTRQAKTGFIAIPQTRPM
jgi:hypothetical protein